MTLAIVPVRSRREFKEFIALPWRIYDPDTYPRWVPPLRLMVQDALDTKKNPFYARASRELWLAVRDGTPVGRIAAIENPMHNEFHHDRVGFFGFFEAQDDQEAATKLLETAAEWLRARGLSAMRGPMSPSTNQECGLLVGGYEEHPMFLTPWNPPYYEKLIIGAGLAPVKELLGYKIKIDDPSFRMSPRYEEQAKRALERSKVVFRTLDLGNFDAEVETWFDIYNSAWEENWGFVPMSREEFVHMAKELKPLLDPRFALVAEVEGKPAGMLLVLLDYNEIFKRIPTGKLLPTGLFKLLFGKKRIRSGRVILLGVKKEHRTRSIFQLFLHEIIRRGHETGVVNGEASWVLEDNLLMNRPLLAMGAQPYRRWRIYERPLTAAVPAGSTSVSAATSSTRSARTA
jgi:GNAT superfamily N-acetyltransferase